MDFFAGRLRNFYQNLGVDTLLVDAALGADLRDVKGCDSRLNALREFSAEPGYSEAVQTFKRVANIVRKQEQAHAEIPAVWRKSLLKEDPEKSLAKVLEELLPRLDQQWEAQDHKGALGLLRELRPTVDAFFDGVMVACEDAELRGNRLAMLKSMADRFARLADFAALQI
jgi:glycyl-tRNA synthetase beta chain